MDWDGIKYIFQIPLGWYRKIDNMVFHAYGSNFLTVREGYYGGLEVGIDNQGFSDAVGQLGYGKVKTVDGKEPDEYGNVSFNLTGGKWLKSDANGHIITSAEDPLSLDDEETGYLYNNNGTLEYKDDEYVTLDTQQTITGEKIFEAAIGISDGDNALAAIYEQSTGLVIQDPLKILTESQAISFTNSTNTGHIDFDPVYGGIEIYTYSGRGGGGYIDFHTDGTSADYSSRIIDLTNEFSMRAVSKPIYLESYYNNVGGGIALTSTGGEYQQLLVNEPSTLYSAGVAAQIATRGFCRSNFAKTSHTHGNISSDGKITASRGATPTDYYVAVDSQGNLFREATSGLSPDMSNYVTTSALNTTLQNYATTTTVSNLTDVVDAINDSYQDANDVSNAIDTALQGYVSTSDLNTTLQDYATLSDIEDFVTSEDLGNYVEVPSGFTGQNSTFSVVTNVSWNGTTLQQTKRQLTFKNGVLVTVGNESTTTIDTPTVITWA